MSLVISLAIDFLLLFLVLWAHIEQHYIKRTLERHTTELRKLRRQVTYLGMHTQAQLPTDHTAEMAIQSKQRPPSLVKVPRPTHRDPEPKERPDITLQLGGRILQPRVRDEWYQPEPSPMGWSSEYRRHQSGEGGGR